MSDLTTDSVARPHRNALIWPVLISLLAFAANSIFCRLALMNGDIDPHSFTAARLLSGGVFLFCLISVRKPAQRLGGHWKGGVSLFLYAYLFSIAYLQLGAGAGALILFGAVQITMFLFSWLKGERVRVRVLLGMLLAFAGLVALLLPGAETPPLESALIMVVAGVAWGAYSLLGRGAANPLADTAGNFIRTWPLLGLLALVVLATGHLHITGAGLLYALASGVLASGAGYAIWYGVVKRISAQHAATLQLSVPVIASLAGVLLLSEPLSLRLSVTSAVVLGGIALALLPSRASRSNP